MRSIGSGHHLASKRLILTLALFSLPTIASAACLASSPPAFTTAQAERGRRAYDARCASCHGTALEGGAATPLKGAPFTLKWRGKSVQEMTDYIRDLMPQDDPGSLSPETAADLTALVLSFNKIKPGAEVLPSKGQSPEVCIF